MRWGSGFTARVSLCLSLQLASAAYYMELEPLIDLTCKAIASSIDWSSPEAIRDAFGYEIAHSSECHLISMLM